MRERQRVIAPEPEWTDYAGALAMLLTGLLALALLFFAAVVWCVRFARLWGVL